MRAGAFYAKHKCMGGPAICSQACARRHRVDRFHTDIHDRRGLRVRSEWVLYQKTMHGRNPSSPYCAASRGQSPRTLLAAFLYVRTYGLLRAYHAQLPTISARINAQEKVIPLFITNALQGTSPLPIVAGMGETYGTGSVCRITLLRCARLHVFPQTGHSGGMHNIAARMMKENPGDRIGQSFTTS